MHEGAIAFLACPACGGGLSLAAGAEPGASPGSVRSGRLVCAGCGLAYPVRRGVPELFAPGAERDGDLARNKGTWDFIWGKTRGLRPGHFASREMMEADFGRGARDLAGAVVLEAGAGSGKYLPHLLDAGARWVFAADVSEEVFALAEAGRDARLCLVRCDLQRPPFRSGAFDAVLSSRVLHHLPDMEAALGGLHRLLRPGGRLAACVYARRPGADLHVRLLEPLKALLRPLGLEGLYRLSALLALLLHAAARGLYRPLAAASPRAAARLPLSRILLFWARLDLPALRRFIVLDILAAPRTRYLCEAELEELLAGLGAASHSYALQHEGMWSLELCA